MSLKLGLILLSLTALVNINLRGQQVTSCASEGQLNHSDSILNDEDHSPEARPRRKLGLAKPQQADCHLLTPRVNHADWQAEVQKIDGQIMELEGLQEKLKSKAKRNANDAMRWQFQHDHYMDARRAWDRAAQEVEKIEEIQGHIDKLKARKQAILKEHGTSPNE